MTRERHHEDKLTDEVKAAGGLCIKLPALLYRGIPDRLVLLPGARIFFVELKTKRGSPSGPQLRFIEFLRTMGFWADIIRGSIQLEEFLDAHVRQDRKPHPRPVARRTRSK